MDQILVTGAQNNEDDALTLFLTQGIEPEFWFEVLTDEDD
jgi:hypothetical protein